MTKELPGLSLNSILLNCRHQVLETVRWYIYVLALVPAVIQTMVSNHLGQKNLVTGKKVQGKV